MKRLIFLALALLLAGSAVAADKLQIMENGKIKMEYIPSTDFSVGTDPTNATDGQMWFNNSTNQIKVRNGDNVYYWNATGSEEFDDGSVTYLVDEDFEGTGTPIGWTITNANANPDDTSNVLAGVQSLSIGSSTYSDASFSFSEQDELYATYLFQFQSGTAATETYSFRIYSGSTDICNLSHGVFDTTSVRARIKVNGGVASSGLDVSMSVGTTYRIWFAFKKSTGTASVWIGSASSTTRPETAAITITDAFLSGVSTDKISFSSTNEQGGVRVFDALIVSDTEFTSVP